MLYFYYNAYTFYFKTAHPGHGDRSGQMLAQVITQHTAVVLFASEQGKVLSAICDGQWDMLQEKALPITVKGTVISGGDTTPVDVPLDTIQQRVPPSISVSCGDTTLEDGPLDTPRTFVYLFQKSNGEYVNVSYTAYPPSPAGYASRARISLSLYNGSIQTGDFLKAYGTYNKETNTVVLKDEGDFIKTYPLKP